MNQRITIVGGGIVGAACALAVVRAGARVTLVESRFPGGGATAAGMGHVVVMDDSPAQLAVTRRSRDLWHGLADSLPAEAEWRRTGTLWVAADDDEMAEAARKRDLLAEAGVAARVLDAAALAVAEPNLRAGLAGGLLVPDDAVVYPPPVAAWLLAAAERDSATVVRGTAVAAVADESLPPGSVRLVDGRTLGGDVVVVAAGTATPRLVPGVPLRPRKGHLVITDRVPGFATHQLIELGYVKRAHDVDTDSVAFNVQPRATGQLLVGSSRQVDVDSREIDPAILREMLDRCRDYMPGLASVPAIRTWTGLRAATPDGLPLVGPWPEMPGVWLATGHEGLGITTSLATAELVAHGLCGAATPLDPLPFLPSRFRPSKVQAAEVPAHG
ncbi:MAG: NAD(P)/FAD-dependent oxidoreductase [Planctomycetaceae bacterium]